MPSGRAATCASTPASRSPVTTARERVNVKFYMLCMVFILLDVDAAFLYPWALVFRQIGVFGFVEMAVFLLLLGGGFVYAWKAGALDS